MSCTGLIVSMGSFQLSQFSVNTHYLALRTTVKKIVVLTAFLFATVVSIKLWRATWAPSRRGLPQPANGNGREAKSTAKNSADGCNGSNCTELYSVVRPDLSRRLTAKLACQASKSMPPNCTD